VLEGPSGFNAEEGRFDEITRYQPVWRSWLMLISTGRSGSTTSDVKESRRFAAGARVAALHPALLA
jgi:hypothetical protein